MGDPEKTKVIRRRAIQAGLKLVDCPIRHMGTEKAHNIYMAIEHYLQENGVEILFGCECRNLIIEDGACRGVIISENGKETIINAAHTVVATGRRGADWLEGLCTEHGIEHQASTVDIGVRVEVRNEVMKTTNNETSSTEGTVTVSRAEYEELKRENERLSNENRWLAEQVTLARKNKFGSKADKVSDEAYEQMSLMFDEPEAIAWVESVQEKKEVAVAAHSRTRKTGALKDIIPDNIPVEVEEHRLEGKDLICEVCGSRMTEIGKTVKQSLKIIPEQVIIHDFSSIISRAIASGQYVVSMFFIISR